MAITLDASLEYAKNELQSQGLLTLFEIQVQATPADYIYWCEYNASVNYFIPETTTPQTYWPAAISRDEIETDDGSKIPSLRVAVGGVDQTIISYLENQDGLRRNRVRAVTVPYDSLGNASACIVDVFYVDGSTIDHSKEIAQFELSSKGQVDDVSVPMIRMRRDSCQNKFKNASTCQYAGGDGRCQHTKDDCASKGNVINFLAFPGIGTKRVYFS